MNTQNLKSTVIISLIGIAFSVAAFIKAGETGTISGNVTDKSTGQALSFVNVSLLDKSKKQVASAQSDLQGNFNFKNVAAGEYSISAKMVGYANYELKKLTVIASKITRIKIEMEPELKNLSEVLIVTQDKADGKKNTTHRAEEKSKNYEVADQIMSLPATTGYSGVVSNQDFNTEQYDYTPENEFHEAVRTALSTFSIDVDVASYANIRRFINSGSLPPVDAVRIEEMINYFDYNYAEPKEEHPFAIHTEVAACPWSSKHKIALIALQGKRIETENLPPSNLTFLIDVSGSMMSENKLPLVKKSLTLLVNQMRAQDKISIAVYAGNAGLVLSPTSGSNREKIIGAINALEAGGSTAGGAGIKLAYKTASENFDREGNNRVILCTDGDFNVGVSSDGELVRMIEEEREKGIYLTVLGFGMGNYKDSKMEKLADKGNGNYAYIDNIMEAKKVLVTQMGGTLFTIAKDVKLQIEFNPSRVKEYKLIGYENRLLLDKDFNDDTKDAGELGSGHTVTALYEIIPVGEESMTANIDPLKYQDKTTVTGYANSNELLTVKFRYKTPGETKSKLIVKTLADEDRSLEKASENLRFASSVAEFGLLLRNSKFKGSSSFEKVISLARSGKGMDTNGYRAEFIRLVETAQLLNKGQALETKD